MKTTHVGLLIAGMLILSLVFLQRSEIIHLRPIELKASDFPGLQTLSLNRTGNQLFKAQNYKAAFENYVQALQYDPFAAELHLNIGLGYEVEQQTDKAISSYQNAHRYAQNALAKFMALFNEAQLHGKAKKYDEALKLYQQALNLNPASNEVKTNIELLIQAQQQEQQQQQENKDGEKDPKDNQDPKDGQGDNKKDPKDDKKDPKDDKNDDKKKDPKEDKKDPKEDKPKPGESPKDEPKEGDKDKDKDKESEKEKDQPKTPAPNQKYQPRPFNGEQLSEADVKKILGEIKQQEQKIRSEFNRKDVKEQPRDKDW